MCFPEWLSPVFVWFCSEPRLKSITIAFFVALIFSGLSGQHLGLLERSMRFFAITVNEMIAAITSVVIAVVLALHGYKYWALVGRQVSLSLAITAGSCILCRWRPSLPGFGTGIGTMLRFGTNLLANNTIYYFSKNLDKVLLWSAFMAPNHWHTTIGLTTFSLCLSINWDSRLQAWLLPH